MVAAVRVHKVGGPEVLTYEEIDVPAPGQGQLRVKQYACGVNFIDVYFRMGMYPSPVGLPFVAGNEGAGEVTAVGPGVTDIKIGDRVAYVVPLGGYSAERLLPAERHRLTGPRRQTGGCADRTDVARRIACKLGGAHRPGGRFV